MYIYPSIFREFGGDWMKDGKLTVNGPEAEAALAWYVDVMRKYAPAAAANWNWPDIADAFSQGTVANYIDAHSSASVVNNPEKSKVIGKVAYARWPKGPSGKRVDLDLELGFSDQRRAVRQEEESHMAVHPVGGERRNPGTHRASLCRPDQALRRQPHLDLERS